MLNSLTMFNEQYLKNHTENFRKRFPKESQDIEQQFGHHEIKPVITVDELKQLCNNNEKLENLLSEVVDYFFKYTETVCEYKIILEKHLADDDVKQELENWDEIRSYTHNAMIDSVNILIRNLGNKDLLTKLPPKENRAAYAALALQNTYLELLKYKEENNDNQQ